MVKCDVRRIIYLSSGGTVYGIPQSIPIKETHSTNPLVSYGIVKLAIEKYLLMYDRLFGIKAIILRVANAYGERQRLNSENGVVGVFLSKALNNQQIEIWGDGTVTRDFIYVADIAEAVAISLSYNGSYNIFNIGAGLGTSLNQLIVKLEYYLKRTIQVRYYAGRSIDVPVSVLCNQLSRQELGWEPKTSLDDGILRTGCWLKKLSNQKVKPMQSER
jgi:UDP-glucose 4-epimerase